MSDQSWFDCGARRFAEAVEHKESLTALVRKMKAAGGRDLELMALGLATAGLATLARVRLTGVRFGQAAAWLNDEHAFCLARVNSEFSADEVRRWTMILTVAAALDECAKRQYIEARRVPARAAEPAPAPLKVEIVGLPDRITTTEIARDDAGNITSSAQLERDLAA